MAEQGEGIVCEVVGFRDGEVMLMPLSAVQGLLPGTAVRVLTLTARVGVGTGLLGRVVDGLGEPLDGGPAIVPDVFVPLRGERKNPLHRAAITAPLDVGVRAINTFLTVGRGQRIGLIAGSGVGKSMLLGMMTRFTEADVIVIGMIGERGREVLDFVHETLGEEGLKRSVVIAAPGDRSPVVRLRATHYSCAAAEYFRDQGQNVLLLMDSLTRVAHAQREVGLAVGEPPTTKGYTPSVFAMMPRLLERAGPGAPHGSITGFFTVLVEGEDMEDPVADTVRGIVDGHIVLSRKLGSMGHYPAIDVLQSVSRTMPSTVPPEHVAAAVRVRALMATYRENEELVRLGAYKQGTDPEVDTALTAWPQITRFLRQTVEESTPLAESQRLLATLAGVRAAAPPPAAGRRTRRV